MTESKSSGQCVKVLMALLTLWFIGSLITIVVWATAPDFKSAAQCRAELKDLHVQHEGSKVVCQKNQEALEQMVRVEREEQEKLRGLIVGLRETLNATNATLEECRLENIALVTNISALQETVDSLQQIQANLTTQLAIKEDEVDALQQNLTQAEHRTEACFSLRDAAQAQTKAAESQLKACQSNQEYLQRQLQKCKVSESEASRQTTPQQTNASPTGSGPGLSSVPGLILLLSASARLLFPYRIDLRSLDTGGGKDETRSGQLTTTSRAEERRRRVAAAQLGNGSVMVMVMKWLKPIGAFFLMDFGAELNLTVH